MELPNMDRPRIVDLARIAMITLRSVNHRTAEATSATLLLAAGADLDPCVAEDISLMTALKRAWNKANHS